MWIAAIALWLCVAVMATTGTLPPSTEVELLPVGCFTNSYTVSHYITSITPNTRLLHVVDLDSAVIVVSLPIPQPFPSSNTPLTPTFCLNDKGQLTALDTADTYVVVVGVNPPLTTAPEWKFVIDDATGIMRIRLGILSPIVSWEYNSLTQQQGTATPTTPSPTTAAVSPTTNPASPTTKAPTTLSPFIVVLFEEGCAQSVAEWPYGASMISAGRFVVFNNNNGAVLFDLLGPSNQGPYSSYFCLSNTGQLVIVNSVGEWVPIAGTLQSTVSPNWVFAIDTATQIASIRKLGVEEYTWMFNIQTQQVINPTTSVPTTQPPTATTTAATTTLAPTTAAVATTNNSTGGGGSTASLSLAGVWSSAEAAVGSTAMIVLVMVVVIFVLLAVLGCGGGHGSFAFKKENVTTVNNY